MPTTPDDELRDRIKFLVANKWNGNQSQMAADIGCSPSVISKVLAGRQEPGRRLIQRISGVREVNPAWLISGVGEPLLAPSQASLVGGWPVPIANRPLPGRLADNSRLLSGEAFYTAEMFYKPSRYYLKIAVNEPILAWSQYRLAAGDLLLLETDEAQWHDASELNWRFCVVRETDGVRLRRLQVEGGEPCGEGPPIVSAELFENSVDPATTFTKPGKNRVLYQIKPDGQQVRVPQPQQRMHSLSIAKRDVVAMGVLLVRRT